MTAEEWNDLFFEDRMRTNTPSSTRAVTRELWRTVKGHNYNLQVSDASNVRLSTIHGIVTGNDKKFVCCNDQFTFEERRQMMKEAFPLEQERL